MGTVKSILFLLVAASAYAAPLGNQLGWCEDGNAKVSTQGMNSTTLVQRSFSACTVTVYLTGTTTTATIFSNATGTSLGNPFTAAASGQWTFWVAPGTYDIKFSGGGIVTPFTRAGYTVSGPVLLTSYGVVCDGSTDTTTNFQNALSDAGAGTIHVAPGSGACIVSALTMSTANQKLECEPGTSIKEKSGSTGPIITVSSTGQAITGCTFDDNGQAIGTAGIVKMSQASNFLFRENTLVVGAGTSYAFRSSGSFNSLIVGNTIPGTSIFFDDGNATYGIKITENMMDVSAHGSGDSIQLSNNSTAAVHDFVVSNNTTVVGPSGFCVEAGVNSGTASVYNITTTGNTCALGGTSSGAQAFGGVSYSQVSQSAVTGNVFYGNGQFAGIAGIELVKCTDCAASGNMLYGPTDTSSTYNGIQANCIRCTITCNVIDGWATKAAGTFNDGILIYTSSAAAFIDNVISGNTFNFPGANIRVGVQIDCRTSGGSFARTVITGNTFNGAGGNDGIDLSGTSTCGDDQTVITGNAFNNVTSAIIAIYATNTLIDSNSYNSVTNRFNDAGNNTWQPITLSFSQPFANLPACAAATKGALANVSDSNTATWGAGIAGGGANSVLAWCSGSAWDVAGK